MKMTTEEDFIKVLQMHGIDNAFGIISSAFMPVSDYFPKAGISFWDVAHECNGGYMADGFTRTTGKMAMIIAQNGPGITNFVTAVKTAYWNHTPMLLVTPQAANRSIGQGGFQEVEQMAAFRDMVAWQEEVRDPARIAEVLNRVITKGKRLSAPVQINVPRDYWTQVIDVELPAIVDFERPAGGEDAIAEAAKLLSGAKFPVILNGAGVVLGGAIPASQALAERLDAPVCATTSTTTPSRAQARHRRRHPSAQGALFHPADRAAFAARPPFHAPRLFGSDGSRAATDGDGRRALRRPRGRHRLHHREQRTAGHRLKQKVEDRLPIIQAEVYIRNSFLAIKKLPTGTGHFRFDAERTDATGHADEFWACLAAHAASNAGPPPACGSGQALQADWSTRGQEILSGAGAQRHYDRRGRLWTTGGSRR